MPDDRREARNEDLVRDWRLDAIERVQARVVDHLEILERAVNAERLDLRYVLRDELKKRQDDNRDWTLRVLVAVIAVASVIEPIVLHSAH